jgi:hypothetical protein
VKSYESTVIDVNLPDKNNEIGLTLSPREFGTEIGEGQKRAETLSIQWAGYIETHPFLAEEMSGQKTGTALSRRPKKSGEERLGSYALTLLCVQETGERNFKIISYQIRWLWARKNDMTRHEPGGQPAQIANQCLSTNVDYPNQDSPVEHYNVFIQKW